MGELAQRAVESDDQDAAAHTSLAIHELFMGRHDDALRRLARAIELNPNSSFAHGYVGVVHAFGGEADLAIESVQEAMRLSPRDLLVVIWRVVEGWAHLSAARFDRAAESARLAIAWNASFADAHAILASALGHAGRLDEARAALGDSVRHLPGLTLRDPRLRVRSAARLIGSASSTGCARPGWQKRRPRWPIPRSGRTGSSALPDAIQLAGAGAARVDLLHHDRRAAEDRTGSRRPVHRVARARVSARTPPLAAGAASRRPRPGTSARPTADRCRARPGSGFQLVADRAGAGCACRSPRRSRCRARAGSAAPPARPRRRAGGRSRREDVHADFPRRPVIRVTS